MRGRAILDQVLRERSEQEWASNRAWLARSDQREAFSRNFPVSHCRGRILDQLRAASAPVPWGDLVQALWARDSGDLAGTTADRARDELLREAYLVESSEGLAVNPAHPSAQWLRSTR